MTKLFPGKIILVAGADQPMVATIIRRFLEEDATVLSPAQSMQQLTRLKSALSNVDTKSLITLLVDYPDYYKAFEIAGIMVARYGKIDLAVFCFADPVEKGSLAETDIIDWEKMIDEQVTAYFVGGRILLSTMKDQQDGMFISVSDTRSYAGSSGSALAALALTMQKKMAEMFGITAEQYNIKWRHISLTHDAPKGIANNSNTPQTPGDCIIALYNSRLSHSTTIFHSFSLVDTAAAPLP